MCRFFEKNGNCRYGKDCKFIHGTSDSNGGSSTSRGGAGAARSASSAAPAAAAAAAAAAAGVGDAGGSPEAAEGGVKGEGCDGGEDVVVELDDGDDCGICLENIPASGKRFGLMNCDHVYCLGQCARVHP